MSLIYAERIKNTGLRRSLLIRGEWERWLHYIHYQENNRKLRQLRRLRNQERAADKAFRHDRLTREQYDDEISRIYGKYSEHKLLHHLPGNKMGDV